MKKLVCLVLLFCVMLPALAQQPGEFLPLYQSPAASRGGETVSVSVPQEEVQPLAAHLAAAKSFSLGAGHTFLYLQQGMLIIEFTAQNAGEYCLVSCRTQDATGLPVFEFLIEQYAAAGLKTLSVLYRYDGQSWLPELMP